MNPAPGTQTVIPPSGPAGGIPHPPPPPPLPPRLGPQSGQSIPFLAAPHVTETVTTNQTELRVCFRQHVDVRFSMKDNMINYLSRLLDQTGIETGRPFRSTSYQLRSQRSFIMYFGFLGSWVQETSRDP